MIHYYYGTGKGKTSAAVGAGLRAYGAGMKVLLVQFLKDCRSSELAAVPFAVLQAPDSLPFQPDRALYRPWVEQAIQAVLASDADMLILDELTDAVPEYLSLTEALSLLDKKHCEVIVTGHRAEAALLEKADYVTKMIAEKHPYEKGVQARKGIEY